MSVIDSWLGKWVIVHMNVTLPTMPNPYVGRLLKADSEWIVATMGGQECALRVQHILGISVALNQDQLTIASMAVCEENGS